MTNTEKCIRDYISMIAENCNVEITEDETKEIVEHCFDNDYLFDTIYEIVTDAVEMVVGELNP